MSMIMAGVKTVESAIIKERVKNAATETFWSKHI